MVNRIEQGELTGDRRRWFGLAAVALTQLMIVLDMTIVNVALPAINAQLNISAVDRQWVITAYTLPFAGLLLLGGRIADYAGRRRTLLIGLFGFAAASVLGGAAPDLQLLVVARAAQGAFGALLAPASLALLTTTFTDPKERGRAFSVFGAVVAAGSPIGLVLGGLLTTFLSWHWVFYVNAPIAVVAALLVVAFLRESRAQGPAHYDIPGAVLATGGLVSVVYAFSLATVDGWTATGTLALLALAVLLIAAFLVVESRVRHPLLPLSVLRNRSRGGTYIVILLMMAGPFGAYLFISYFLQDVQGFSALTTGLAFLPLTLGVMVSAGMADKLMTRIAPRFMMAAGLLVGAVGMLLLTRLDIGSGYFPSVLPSLVLIGLGMGAVLPLALNLATYGVRPDEAGVASSMFNVAQQSGASLDTALLNTVAAATSAAYLATQGSDRAAQLASQVHGYNAATLCAACVLTVAAVVALFVVNGRITPPPMPDRPAAEPVTDSAD